MIHKIFLDHPRSVDETFGQHFIFAPVSYTHLTLPTIYSV